MSKEELINLLKELNIPVHECTPADSDMNEDVRVYYFEYIWADEVASGDNYVTNVTYQVSFVADKPRHEKLLELKRKLNDAGIFPQIQHEYLPEKRQVHSFFSVEVLEELEEGEANE